MKPYGISWEEYIKLEESKRAQYLNDKGKIYDVIFSQQYDKSFLDEIYILTNKIRLISKTREGQRFLKNLLGTKKALLYFIQPSSRTFLSFFSACATLGIACTDIRSTEISSESKGESPEDTIRTFSSYFDAIIMRHPEEGYAEKASFVLNNYSRRPIPIINAGSGKDQHPTQALLDIFTLQKSLGKIGGVDGKTIMFVGDLKRGRTVRSLSYLLGNFKNVKFIFCAPEGYQMEKDIVDYLKERQYEVVVTSDMKKYLSDADAVYMTRLQDEYDKVKGESSLYNTSDFSLGLHNINLVKPSAFIMHPLPRRSEISTDIDKDPRALYWRQMRNGMWTRAALLAYIFGVDTEIIQY